MFKPTHVFTLLDGTTIPVTVEERGDPIAWEEDGTRWHTVCGVMETWWTCTTRGVVRLKTVSEWQR